MIEEVKKILEEYEEENQHFRGILCTMYHPLAIELCQLFKPDRPDREKIEGILEPTLDRLYRWNLPKGKYEEIAIKASIDMLKSNLTTQILALIEEAKKQIKQELCANCDSPLIREVEEGRIEELFKAIISDIESGIELAGHKGYGFQGNYKRTLKYVQSLKDKWGVK